MPVVVATIWLAGELPVAASTNQHVILVTIDGLAAYYLADPAASIPTLRKLAAEGAVAEGLRVSNPTVTWPNHTTLVTGVHPNKHSVLFNGVLVRFGPGKPVAINNGCDQQELVAVPTLFDRLHAAGYRTAGINWPCTRNAAGLDDNMPDVLGPISNTTPALRAELIVKGILKDDRDSTFRDAGPVAADKAWTAAAIHVLQQRRPNLLLLHLLATDTAQHRFGPQSPEAYKAISAADAHVGELVAALGAAGLRESTTILVASDHGFARPLKLVNPNVIFRKAGLMRTLGRTTLQTVSEGGMAFVYVTDAADREAGRKKAIELLKGQEGIARILEPGEFAELHLPSPEKNSQMADLVLLPKDGFAFEDEIYAEDVITSLGAPAGSHGYVATDLRMNGMLIAWGRGIKAGVKLGLVDNRDVAPTIAWLLDERLPGVDGKVCKDLLVNKDEGSSKNQGPSIRLR